MVARSWLFSPLIGDEKATESLTGENYELCHG
jgi:hypothetical protein